MSGLMDPFVSLLEVHKLMYFAQEAGEPLRLKYVKAPYGPYAENLRHVLSTIEGYMIAGYGDESPLGNFAADALRVAAQADIGIINGGGLRADLPPGALTYGALYEAFPFDNQLVSVEMSGADLRRTVVHNLHSRYGALSYSGLSVSARCEGGKVLVDIKLPSGRMLDAKAPFRRVLTDLVGGDDVGLVLDRAGAQ